MGELKQPKSPKQAFKAPKPVSTPKKPKKIVGMDVIKPLFKSK